MKWNMILCKYIIYICIEYVVNYVNYDENKSRDAYIIELLKYIKASDKGVASVYFASESKNMFIIPEITITS